MFDVPKHLGAVTRSVESTTHDGRPAKVAVATRTYPTSPDDLWTALIDPERLPRWFAPVSGDLRLGGRFQIEGNAAGEVLACDAPKRLALTWEFGGELSWVEVLLDGSDDSTTLILRHTAELTDQDRWDMFGPGAVGIGWELSLMGLAEHLTSERAMNPEAVEAWSTSDEGREYMTGAATGWGEAAAAGGDDRDAAMAAAARTAAFYTGAEPPA